MSFSSRRRNYFLTPHRRDGLIEWMKSMLMHSFVLDALATTGPDTFSHFEELINEHRDMCGVVAAASATATATAAAGTTTRGEPRISRLKRVVPTVGIFHTPLPLRKAYEAYNTKYRLDKRRHLSISFNELRHIMNLAQIMALTTTTTTTKNKNKKKIGTTGMHQENDNDDDDDDDDDDDMYNNAVRQWSQDSPALVAKNNNNNNEDNSIHNIPELSLDGNGELGPEPGDDTDDNDTNKNDASSSSSSSSPSPSVVFNGPALITFDGDQTLYSDGKNFDSNPTLAYYIYVLLQQGVHVAVVTAAGYEYETAKYELRLSGLLQYFQQQPTPLTAAQLQHFYLFGGECNYLLRLGGDYHLHPVPEHGPHGWMTSSTQNKEVVGASDHYSDSPAHWEEATITQLLDRAEASLQSSIVDQNLRNARFIRKKRSVGVVPASSDAAPIPREALDETVLRVQEDLEQTTSSISSLPYCAFNGGRDVWVDVGNKRVGVQLLQAYLQINPATHHTLHIGDQFLNTGNDYAARSCCPCVWITSPEETTYVLKSILRLAGVVLGVPQGPALPTTTTTDDNDDSGSTPPPPPMTTTTSSNSVVDFAELERRTRNAVASTSTMDVFTGEMIPTTTTTTTTTTHSSTPNNNNNN